MGNCFRFRDRHVRFADFCQAVGDCTLCSRMTERSKVMSAANGNVEAKVVFVAEAPGRLGADRTGVPLHGDRTGDNFESLLGNVGWHREELFVTNAILCNPRKENGNNGTPTKEEIRNCAQYLEMTLELVNPAVVVPLGIVALTALQMVHPHGLSLKQDVSRSHPWAGRVLVPLYHPGPRALIHRSLAKQRSDYMRLAKLVHPVKGLIRRPSKSKGVSSAKSRTLHPSSFEHVICTILQALRTTTYFKLTKLMYLADLWALERLGRSVTGEIYLRQEEGPWPPQLKKSMRALDGHEVHMRFRGRTPIVTLGPSPRFIPDLDEEALGLLADVLDEYGNCTNAQIKRAVYHTAPMRYLLRQEKQGRDMRKVPVIYKEALAPEIDGKE